MSEGSTFQRVAGAGDNASPLVLANMKSPKNGYVYVYLSNESNEPVYFDNFLVGDNRGRIIEEDHYYAFGLTMSGISSKALGGVENKLRYNGKELQNKEFTDGSGLETYDYGARHYDPQLARWFVVDPKADQMRPYSPYNYTFNNPIRFIDRDGMVPSDIIILNAQKVVGGLGHAAVLIGDDKHGWYLYSKNGTMGSSHSSTEHSSGPSNIRPERGVYFSTLKDFANKENFNYDLADVEYTRAFRIKTTEEKDTKMKTAALKSVDSWYDVTGLFSGSCIDVCSDALKAGGLDPGYVYDAPGSTDEKGLDAIPNKRYNIIVKNNPGGADATSSITPEDNAAYKVKKKEAKMELQLREMERAERIFNEY